MESNASQKNNRLIIGGLIALAIAFFGGWYVGATGATPLSHAAGTVSSLPPENVDFAPLYEAWRILDQNFSPASTTATTSDQERVWGAISGLASSYGDPYTVFFPPKDKEIFESEVRGDFEGVGMEIGVRDSVLTVIAPLKDTPAYRAGLQSGDKILSIDGVSTSGMSTDEGVQRIRGKKGTTVVLNIYRDGVDQPFDVSVTRDTITLPTVDTMLRDDGVFVLHLYTFNSLAPQLFRNAIAEFADSGSDKLIIDLRGNPGGYLEVAVDLASWFLPVGKTIVTEDYEDNSKDRVHRSRGYNVFTDKLKLVILIDQGSASASEIFAGALRQNGVGTLIGTRSFGKGSVQQLFPLTEDTSLKITVAHWLTPNGTSISNGGITPDVEVDLSDEDRKAGRDPQLERAAQFLVNGK